mmetsp:Transcript_61045/g.132344  ORF Transcript_61045/g.132344 Transcript_61045/m.132344 type:complete len:127 (-) Transcript_61045:167-547(-)|eukprot:CAMPEP_0170612846 /NCGR_PEP_ID=MMETSP0224-20130122/23946_1 /TAXON_ID=285029 /ORGANISM="Togula jolla, Strain CCCM 725" /LENGTH=126 /DNA_ID=CAMNT_0010938387 /DNA_START=69 /DNA_END=449 /DNA_ORIENTATION=+
MDANEENRARQQANMQASQEGELQKMQEREQQRKEMEERKRMMIRQILEPEALERLSRIGLVKPEKKEQMEATILQIAQSGQLQEKMSESMLIQLMERADAQVQQSTVKFRRKPRDDDDDIDLDNL